MTPKQKQFCREYLLDLNGTQAAIRAGYSARTAESQASTLLRNPKVKKLVSELMAKRSEETSIDARWTLARLARIAEFDVRKLFDAAGNLKAIDQLDDDTAYALAGIDVLETSGDEAGTITLLKKFKAADRLRALELIGKHLGMFVDKVEHTGQVTPQIIVYGNRPPDNNQLPPMTGGTRVFLPANGRE